MYIYTHTSVTSILGCLAPEQAVLSILLTTAVPDIQNMLNKCLLNAWKFQSLSCEKEVMFSSVSPHPPSVWQWRLHHKIFLMQAVSTPGGGKLKLVPQITMLVQGQCNLVDALNIDLRII